MAEPVQDVEGIARRLTKAQRQCGNALDDFPCVQCNAKGPGGCPLPPSATIPLADAINRTPGLGNHLRSRVRTLRAHLLSQDSSNDK